MANKRSWPKRLAMAFVAFWASWGAGSVALSGPQHALWPELHGWVEIAPGVWLDDPSQTDRALEAITFGTDRARGFFGTDPVPPRTVLCTQLACSDKLHLHVRGLTYGRHLVLIGPGGVTPEIVAHEFAHVALHRRMGPRDLIAPRFPAWFDEGLAVWVSRDDRFSDFGATPWIGEAQTFRDWSRLVDRYGWKPTYGAARARVVALHARIGDDGLRALIADVENGAAFEVALAARAKAPS